jgi:predicted 2-oxoglutarate/Fe(II)-dependent dioxygenase YbiX
MKKNIEDYVKQYSNFLDLNLCNKTVKELNLLNKSNWIDHDFYDPITNKIKKLSGNKELSITQANNISTTKDIMKKLWNGIQIYMKDLNFKWFSGWQGYTEIRFNKYSKNTKMAEHCDHIHSMFDGQRKGIPILSVLGILNDNYKGGEFIMFKDKEIKFKTGDLLIFPSNFLYPHKVEPVTKGIRYSFISWVW